MTDNIKEIYNEIKEKLTAEHLKKITANIINSYKNRNNRYLRNFISILEIDSDIHNNKLFSVLIKQYHPDKLSYILKQAEEIYFNNNLAQLKKFYERYFFNIESTNLSQDYDIKFEAEYQFDENDFGYREKNIFQEDDNFGESNLDYGEEEHGFIEAINKLFFGGLDYNIANIDLHNIDGDLDLSDYDINDLTGIEQCIYIDELNLSNNIDKIGKLSTLKNLRSLFISNNLIDNITCIESLKNLKEIDLSFNKIMDISVLKELPELEYVNIIGNPINDYSIINALVKKGVIVIHEHINLLF